MSTYLIDDICAILANIGAIYAGLFMFYNWNVITSQIERRLIINRLSDTQKLTDQYESTYTNMSKGKRTIVAYFLLQLHAVVCFAALGSMVGFPRLGRNDASIGMLDTGVAWRQGYHISGLILGIISLIIGYMLVFGVMHRVKEAVVEARTAVTDAITPI